MVRSGSACQVSPVLIFHMLQDEGLQITDDESADRRGKLSCDRCMYIHIVWTGLAISVDQFKA